MEYKQLESRKFFKLPNPGLRAYMTHVENGNMVDYRTPFYGGIPRDEIMDKWQRELDRLQIATNYPGLSDYEIEMRAKVGPLSIMKPLKDRIPDVENYYSDIQLSSTPISSTAIAATIE